MRRAGLRGSARRGAKQWCNDLNVCSFYAKRENGPFPYRWRGTADHGPSAFGRFPDDPLGQDLPAQRLRPEPGQAGQIVSVNDDVVESDGHAYRMRGTLDRIPEIRCSTVDGSITGGHATR